MPLVKSRIKHVFKYRVWKVSHPNRPYPMYLFNFLDACRLAGFWTQQGK